MIRKGNISFAGNRKLKIFGSLTCASGKKMKKDNRVFFKTRDDALQSGYRPCGHCMITAYREWKKDNCGINSK
jgi:methylphosphotriester-DNA--protein-cysteine methyltransferase